MDDRKMRSGGLGRLFAPDALRGLIIVLMALDHANIFIARKHSSGEYWGGGFPVYNDALAFLTRFVTHFCAPGFFFLMGAGMALFAHSRQERGWSRPEIIRHFLIRGAALILLQLLVVFGQVPLFFYVLHLFLYAALGYWLTPGGTSILAMYPLWLLSLLILFPLCLCYRRFKHRQSLRSVLQYL